MAKKSKKPSVFVSDTKKTAALQQIRNGRSRREVAVELGVSLPTVHLWMAKLNQPAKAANSLATTRTLIERVNLLEAEVENLKSRLALFDLRSQR